MDSLESNVFINEDDFLKKINCFNLNLIEVDSYNDLDIILSMSVEHLLIKSNLTFFTSLII